MHPSIDLFYTLIFLKEILAISNNYINHILICRLIFHPGHTPPIVRLI